MLSLADAVEALKGVRPNWAPQIITDASVDSREVIPGSLFVAIPGEQADGHDYVGEAFARGACYALVQQEISERILSSIYEGIRPLIWISDVNCL
jgi:UDP-N-acetylmuramoyl-tripeptide--D-alanyl-D-alanine ligase